MLNCNIIKKESQDSMEAVRRWFAYIIPFSCIYFHFYHPYRCKSKLKPLYLLVFPPNCQSQSPSSVTQPRRLTHISSTSPTDLAAAVSAAFASHFLSSSPPWPATQALTLQTHTTQCVFMSPWPCPSLSLRATMALFSERIVL